MLPVLGTIKGAEHVANGVSAGCHLPVSPPTLADVAERAGVSRQTVSNAVNNPDLLRPGTLERVRSAIEEMGYSPNRAARNLRTRTSQLIGLRVSPVQEGTANAMMDRFVHTLVETSALAGHHVLLFTGDDEDPVAGYDNLLRSTAVDAFVVTDTYLGNPQAAWLTQQRAPFVAFGRPWDQRAAPATRGSTSTVPPAPGSPPSTSLAQGHTRIAWIGWRKDSPHRRGPARRLARRACASAACPPPGSRRRVEDTVQSGREAAAVLLDESAPTAFVCASDTLAMGVLHTLWLRQLAPGARHRGGGLRRLAGRAGLPGRA